jgi:uncharacterized integral membrane protein
LRERQDLSFGIVLFTVRPKSHYRGMKPKLIIGGALLLLVIIFAVQNAAVVTIQFLPWKFSASLALVIFLTGAAGTIIGWVLGTAFKITRSN